jgi:rhamnulose-1-phosphate aldolase
VEALTGHDLAIWDRHGCIATGPDLYEAFDLTDILAKAVKIFYLIG